MSTPSRVALAHAIDAEAQRIAVSRAQVYACRPLTATEQADLLSWRVGLIQAAREAGETIRASDLLTIAAELNLWLADIHRSV